MKKPEFAKIVMFTPAEIKAIRICLRMTQEDFGRLFPLTVFTIASWESGRRKPYGSSSTLLQQFKAYTDHVTEEKRLALERLMEK